MTDMAHYAYSCPCCGFEVEEEAIREGATCGGCGFQYRLVYVEDDDAEAEDETWRRALKNKGFTREAEEGEEEEAAAA